MTTTTNITTHNTDRWNIYIKFLAAAVRSRNYAHSIIETFEYLSAESYNEAITHVLAKLPNAINYDQLENEIYELKKPLLPVTAPEMKQRDKKTYRKIMYALAEKKMRNK